MANESQYLHHSQSLCDEGGFKVSKVANFQKQGTNNTSIATDGTYIYAYISATNGGMYKIGTGEGGSVAGKIHLYAPVNKVEEICWVYCKEKLYLRNTSREVSE